MNYAMLEALERALILPTVDVRDAGLVLGFKGKNVAYEARKSGDIPSIEIGGAYRVPTELLLQKINLSAPDARAAALERVRNELRLGRIEARKQRGPEQVAA